MKNKRLLYILLPAVLVIWGLIFKRLWSAAEGPTKEAGPLATASVATTQFTLAHHPPALILAYADPFKNTRDFKESPPRSELQQSPLYSNHAPRSLNLTIAPIAGATVPVVWPRLKYLGSIMNAHPNKCIALLSVDEQETMIKMGAEHRYKGVQVIKIFRDSVQLLRQGQLKTVVRDKTP